MSNMILVLIVCIMNLFLVYAHVKKGSPGWSVLSATGAICSALAAHGYMAGA